MDGDRSNSNRDLPLDFVKGILVIVMVIYHIMNYFSTAGPEEFGFVRFVSGSFIFVSGYIISTFYEKKYRMDRAGTSRRLFVRGVKLLVIFTVLNVLINLTGIGNPRKPLGIENYLNNLTAIYMWGNIKLAAFAILLPISYLLVLSPVFLFLKRFNIFLTLATLSIAFLYSFSNIESDNLSLGIVGIVGLSVGRGKNGSESISSIKNWKIILCFLIVCICLIRYSSDNAMTYSIGIMILLKLLYDLAKIVNLEKQISQAIILFGQYTLVSYIMQIVFLQGLFRVLSKQRWGLGYETMFIFIGTNVFLLGLCSLVKYLRNCYGSMDKAYGIIFS